MPNQRFLDLASEAQKRAEQILTKAETFRDGQAKQGTREIAAEYEKLAARLEQAAET
jgi:hypothetical protein